jgi:hypothetical protein
MKEARQQQRVNRAEFYGMTVNQDDFVDQLAPTTCASSDDGRSCLSAYSLASQYTDDIWKESFTLDKHIGQMWRKIAYHLPKATCTMKILRLLFRLMGEQMLFYIDSKDGNRSSYSKGISDTFIQKMSDVLDLFFEANTRTVESGNSSVVLLLLTSDDVEIGCSWTRWKLETTRLLFSINGIQDIVNARLGKPQALHLFATK